MDEQHPDHGTTDTACQLDRESRSRTMGAVPDFLNANFVGDVAATLMSSGPAVRFRIPRNVSLLMESSGQNAPHVAGSGAKDAGALVIVLVMYPSDQWIVVLFGEERITHLG